MEVGHAEILQVLRALKHMGKASTQRMTWTQCCESAVTIMPCARVDYVQTDWSVRRWHCIFCDKMDTFPHPNPEAAAGNVPDPPFFREFPEAKLCLLKKKLTSCLHTAN